MRSDFNFYCEIKYEFLHASLTKTDLIGKILENSDRPMNLKEIADVAKKEHNTEITRDSMSSILSKKVRAGKDFIRTGPNEFYLRKKVYS